MTDSIRFYYLNKNNRRVEMLGVETAYGVNDAIVI